MATRNMNRPATQTNAPCKLTTTNGNKLAEQTSKLLQIETNGEAKDEAATEVIELKSRNSPPMPPKDQKPIQPPPPSIAVNESRYVFSHPYQIKYVLHTQRARNRKNMAFHEPKYL